MQMIVGFFANVFNQIGNFFTAVGDFIAGVWDFIVKCVMVLQKYHTFFTDGLKSTLGLVFFAIIIGALLGVILAISRLSKYKFFRFLSSTYTEIFRGTPLMVQVIIANYGLPMLFGKGSWIASNSFITGAIVLGLNSAAYVGEIFRGGIQSIDIGQTEAARSLGMSSWQNMIYIVLPQAIRNALPSLGNEFVVLIKESSIVSIIGIGELMYQAKAVVTTTYDAFPPYILVSLIYFVLTFTISKFLLKIERNMGQGRKQTNVESNANENEGRTA